MSLNVAALEILVAKGMSAQDILEIARALEIKKDPTATERKRRQREREADERDLSHRDVTRDTSLPLPPNDNNSNPPTPAHKNNIHTRESRPAKQPKFQKPYDVSERIWTDFVQHRRTKRAPVSETVIAGIRREAKKAGWSLENALAETVTRGWQSFQADWVSKPAIGSTPNGNGSFLDSLGRAGP